MGRVRKTVTVGSCAEGLSIPDYHCSREYFSESTVVTSGSVDRVSETVKASVIPTIAFVTEVTV